MKDKQGALSSTGDSMARLQQEDPDISFILQLHHQRKDQPRPEEMISHSEVAKILWSQWHSLVIVNGVLYRRIQQKHGKLPLLQLVVPVSTRTEFTRRCHEGMTGGHRAVQPTLDQVRRRGYWVSW